MKTKYRSVNLYATQGGGTAISGSVISGNSMSINYYFHQVPNWGDFKVGDMVPYEWGIQYCGQLLTILPKEERKIESRNSIEGTYQERNSYFNRKRKVTRVQKKRAKLAAKGTLRSCTPQRIKEIMHWVGVNMAREERQEARKNNKPIHFYEGDELRVVSTEGYESTLQLKDICIMEQQDSEPRNMIVVTNRRTKEMKLFRKDRFILHKRYIENE